MEIVKCIRCLKGRIPNGHCDFSNCKPTPPHAVCDSLVLLTYLSLPLTFVYFVRRGHLPFESIFICFGVVMVASGLKSALGKRNGTVESRGELQPCEGFFRFE